MPEREIRFHNFAAENCRVSCWGWRMRGIVCALCAAVVSPRLSKPGPKEDA